MKENDHKIIYDEIIVDKIFYMREQKVMLDRDLAELYGVETKVLKQAVRRNIGRFPADFMFEATEDEYKSLRNQTGTGMHGAHTKYLPMIFTEQGVSMLSSVISSPQAISVNIQIIRIFTKLRQLLSDSAETRFEILQIKNTLSQFTNDMQNQHKNIEIVFQYLDELLNKKEVPAKGGKSMGFKFAEEALERKREQID